MVCRGCWLPIHPRINSPLRRAHTAQCTPQNLKHRIAGTTSASLQTPLRIRAPAELEPEPLQLPENSRRCWTSKGETGVWRPCILQHRPSKQQKHQHRKHRIRLRAPRQGRREADRNPTPSSRKGTHGGNSTTTAARNWTRKAAARTTTDGGGEYRASITTAGGTRLQPQSLPAHRRNPTHPNIRRQRSQFRPGKLAEAHNSWAKKMAAEPMGRRSKGRAENRRGALRRDDTAVRNYESPKKNGGQKNNHPDACAQGVPGGRSRVMLTQSGGLEAQCRLLRVSNPPSRCPRRCKRAGRSVRGIKRVLRSVCGSWSVGVDGKLWMDV